MRVGLRGQSSALWRTGTKGMEVADKKNEELTQTVRASGADEGRMLAGPTPAASPPAALSGLARCPRAFLWPDSLPLLVLALTYLCLLGTSPFNPAPHLLYLPGSTSHIRDTHTR